MRDTDKNVLRLIYQRYGFMLERIGKTFNILPEILAGIMMRESAGGISHLLDKPGPEGRGDNGHGHGLMQIDDRSFPAFCNGKHWRIAYDNIEYAARILRKKMRYLQSKLLLVTTEMILASYNAGEGRVVKTVQEGKDADSVTAHGNYAKSVLEYAEAYAEIVKEQDGLREVPERVSAA